MDEKTEELRAAHDVLAHFYVDYLAGQIEGSPVDRAMLDLFSELTLPVGVEVGDIGCGTGRLTPYLEAKGLRPTGVDLSAEMVRLASRDHPGVTFRQGDVRDLPFPDESLAGVIGWYSLMYLTPADRPRAYRELHRVVKPGGHLLTGFKAGDGGRRRGGRAAGQGVEFDVYWQTPAEVRQAAEDAGFRTVFWAGLPSTESWESPAQGFLIAVRA